MQGFPLFFFPRSSFFLPWLAPVARNKMISILFFPRVARRISSSSPPPSRPICSRNAHAIPITDPSQSSPATARHFPPASALPQDTRRPDLQDTRDTRRQTHARRLACRPRLAPPFDRPHPGSKKGQEGTGLQGECKMQPSRQGSCPKRAVTSRGPQKIREDPRCAVFVCQNQHSRPPRFSFAQPTTLPTSPEPDNGNGPWRPTQDTLGFQKSKPPQPTDGGQLPRVAGRPPPSIRPPVQPRRPPNATLLPLCCSPA